MTLLFYFTSWHDQWVDPGADPEDDFYPEETEFIKNRKNLGTRKEINQAIIFKRRKEEDLLLLLGALE